MTGYQDPIADGNGALVIPKVESPNYVPGVSGWAIFQDGSAEFNNLDIRGTFIGSNFVINTSGAFFYSGTPATGNLIMSLANATGTDSHGNAYLAGMTTYLFQLGTFFAVNVFGVIVGFYTASVAGGPYTRSADIRATGIGDLAIDATNLILLTAAVDNTGTPSSVNMNFPSIWQTDIWHTMSLVGGTSAGTDINGTTYTPSYMLDPGGNLRLRGVLSAGAGGLASGTTFAQLLVGQYLPQGVSPPTCLVSNAAHGTFVHVYIRPNGNLQFNGALGAGVSIYLDCTLNINGT